LDSNKTKEEYCTIWSAQLEEGRTKAQGRAEVIGGVMVLVDALAAHGKARLGIAWWILKDHVGSGSLPHLTCIQQIMVV